MLLINYFQTFLVKNAKKIKEAYTVYHQQQAAPAAYSIVPVVLVV